MGYNEAYQIGESIASLLAQFDISVTKVLYGDSRAALSQCTSDTGAWRTRHLRLRSAKLREALREDASSGWVAEHLRGDVLVADGLTKPLVGQAYQRFKARLGMHFGEQPRQKAQAPQEEKKGIDDGSALKKVTGILAVAGGMLMKIGCYRAGAAVLAGAVATGTMSMQRGQGQKPEANLRMLRLPVGAAGEAGGKLPEDPRATQNEAEGEETPWSVVEGGGLGYERPGGAAARGERVKIRVARLHLSEAGSAC